MVKWVRKISDIIEMPLLSPLEYPQALGLNTCEVITTTTKCIFLLAAAGHGCGRWLVKNKEVEILMAGVYIHICP